MMKAFAERYLPALDSLLREIVCGAPRAPGFNVQLEYPMGWVDADGYPVHLSGGKRIRPLLLLLCAEATGNAWEPALPAAASVELIHNFSLVHDDIEDASPLRHGRPTVWQQWGLENAINTGDALFALAYTAMGHLHGRVPDSVAVKAYAILNETNLLLTRGQHLDMRFERQPVVTVDEYLTMIEGKSAALLAAAAQLGALIGSGDSDAAAIYHRFGTNLGIAFQIRDDILGIWGDPAVTGKSAATDILSRKKSLPVLFALERSGALRSLYAQEPFGDAEVAAAIQLLDELGAQVYAKEQETIFHQRALEALQSAGDTGPASESLLELMESLLGRAA